jgi:hypothetical protein
MANLEPMMTRSFDLLCFDTNAFKVSAFDVSKFVHEGGQHVTLQTLQNDLDVYLSTIKRELVAVINDDYEEFVLLSTKMTGVDHTIAKLKEPVLKLREKISCVRTQVNCQVDSAGSHILYLFAHTITLSQNLISVRSNSFKNNVVPLNYVLNYRSLSLNWSALSSKQVSQPNKAWKIGHYLSNVLHELEPKWQPTLSHPFVLKFLLRRRIYWYFNK